MQSPLDSSSASKWSLGLVFGLWFTLWFVIHQDGILNLWWAADDYSCWDKTIPQLWGGGLYHGRPVGVMLYWLYHITSPDNFVGFLVLKILQGSLHAAIGTLVSVGLFQYLSPKYALLATAPFQIWAFHYEAVVWWSGSIYLGGAILSIGGILLVIRAFQKNSLLLALIGSILCGLSVLSNQAAGTAGLAFWVILSALRLIRNQISWKSLALETVTIGLGYLSGSLLSTYLMAINDYPRFHRATSFTKAFHFWEKLITRLWFAHPYYSPALLTSNLLLLLSISTGVLLQTFTSPLKWGLKRLLPLLGFLVLWILPVLSTLIVESQFVSGRILYVAPLLITAGIAIASLIHPPPVRSAVMTAITVLTLISVALNAWTAQQVTRDCVNTFQNDLNTLRQIEAVAQENGAHEVLFFGYSMAKATTTNPYNLKYYVYLTPNQSVYLMDAWNYRFLKYFSSEVQNVDWWKWDELRKKYQHLATDLPHQPRIGIHYAPEDNIVIVLPR